MTGSAAPPDAMLALVEALRRLPGVGVKSAQRMAYHLLQHDRDGALRLSQALDHAVHGIVIGDIARYGMIAFLVAERIL